MGTLIGCASALCLALRQLGETAWVLPNEDAHGLFTPYLEGVLAPAGFLPQHVVAVDVASLGMLPDSAGAYKDRIDLVIDHHGSNEGYGRETCVDPSCAACGELLYRIFQAMAISFTPEIAMLLYMAIATDTGCFVYSNTTPETHRIAAALMAVGFDAQWVNRRHFRVKSLKRMQLEGRLVQEMELAPGGHAGLRLCHPGSHRRSPGHRGGFGGYLLLHRSGGRSGQRGHHPPAVPPGVQNFPAHRRQDPQRLRCLCPPRRGRTSRRRWMHHLGDPRPGQSSHAGRH
ncbi:MAG: DHH family phosphoesterase [Evtepia gabavorous]